MDLFKLKLFKDQINIFKKIPDLGYGIMKYCYNEYYEDNKETNLRLFRLFI